MRSSIQPGKFVSNRETENIRQWFCDKGSEGTVDCVWDVVDAFDGFKVSNCFSTSLGLILTLNRTAKFTSSSVRVCTFCTHAIFLGT